MRWLRRAAAVLPDVAPTVVAEDADSHIFAMTFIPGAPVWKDELIAGRIDADFAAAVGRSLVTIHAATANDPTVAAEFRTGALFDALRIDPFLRYVAERDPARGPRLQRIAASLAERQVALVHGDVSPKNILVGPAGPVLLDAECAVYGDPAFDLAFCLTHLLLKAVWLSDHRGQLLAAARALADAYLAGVEWEQRSDLDRRAATLTAALLLARVDGKSPAAYLDEADRATVRGAARLGLTDAHLTLTTLLRDWPALS